MRSIFAIIAFIIAVLVATLAIAAPQDHRSGPPGKVPQEHPQRPPAEPLPDITDTAVAKFIGTWKGTAAHRMPGQPEPSVVSVTENAEWKLGETALFIEGRGVMMDPDTGTESVVHDALGIIRYDPRSRNLMFHGFKAGEPANESELELLDNGDMRWFLQPAPNALVRFTISITDDTWTEIGEFSRDGGVNYSPFMEMNLTRVNEE